VKILVTLVVAACLVGRADVAGAFWILDADANAIWEDNVGLGKFKRDINSDSALSTSLSAGPAFQLDTSTVFSLTGDVSGKLYERYTGLDNVALGLTATLRRKFGLGAEAPWARAWGSIARQQYDNDLRDSWIYRLGVGAGKRFGERWDFSAEYIYDRRLADHDFPVAPGIPGDVFDLSGHTLALRGNFLFNERISFLGGYSLRIGEVASTTQQNLPIYLASTAVSADPAFGKGFFAYRIDAFVHTLIVGLSVAIGEHSSANVEYSHVIGDARGDITYHDNIIRVGFLYRY